MRSQLLTSLVLAALPAAVLAETAAPAISRETRTDVAVTVYNQDLALVKDTREIPLPGLRHTEPRPPEIFDRVLDFLEKAMPR